MKVLETPSQTRDGSKKAPSQQHAQKLVTASGGSLASKLETHVDADNDSRQALVAIQTAAPRVVFCLETALSLHTQFAAAAVHHLDV